MQRGVVPVVLALLLMAAADAPARADMVEKSWEFTEPGNTLGWRASSGWRNVQVADGYWSGDTGESTDRGIVGPVLDPAFPVQRAHYLSFHMRQTALDLPDGKPGDTSGSVYWRREEDPTVPLYFSPERQVDFRFYSDGEWQDVNVLLGDHPRWPGQLKQFMVGPTTRGFTHVDLKSIRLMLCETRPSFRMEGWGSYSDGDTISDPTPTVTLSEVQDPFGIATAEFLWRPSSTPTEEAWVLDGTDTDPVDGLSHTYSPLADGTYDLAVRLTSRTGLTSTWADGDDRWVDHLTIQRDAVPEITVDVGVSLGNVPREIFGNNVTWTSWSEIYDTASGDLPAHVQEEVNRLKVRVLRFPGGCDADTFYWKRSIGPHALREAQYSNDCASVLWDSPRVPYFGLDDFLRYCETHAMTPMVTCRYRWPGATADPRLGETDPYGEALQDAADLVEYCNSPNDESNPNGGVDWAQVRALNGHPEPYGVKLFEIGNEPWDGDPVGGVMPADPPGQPGLFRDIYIASMREYLAAMRAVDPQILPSVAAYLNGQMRLSPGFVSDNRYLWRQLGPDIERIHAHIYLPFSGKQTDPAALYYETMASATAADVRFRGLRALIESVAPYQSASIKLRLSEWDINYDWEYDPANGLVNQQQTKTLKAAIAGADMLRVLIENREFIETAAWFHLYGNWAWAVFGRVKNPIYYTLLIYANRLGDELVSTKVQAPPTFDYVQGGLGFIESHSSMPLLTAISGRSSDRRKAYLIVMNKSRTEQVRARIHIRDLAGASGSAMGAGIWELNGPDVDGTNDWGMIGITESSRAVAEDFEHVFPAHSVTSFVIGDTLEATAGMVHRLADGVRIELTDIPVTAWFDSSEASERAVYVEEDDRSAGLKLLAPNWYAAEGDRISVTGVIQTDALGERCLKVESVANHGGKTLVRPLRMTQRTMMTPGIETNGLLARVTGIVLDRTGDTFDLSDGSVPASFIRVRCSSPPDVGSFVSVVGVKSLLAAGAGGASGQALLTRKGSDIQVIAP